MTFTTSLDESAKKKTAGIALLFISGSLLFFIAYQKQWAVPLIYLGFFVIIFLVSYLFKPYKYSLTETNIIIHRLIGNVLIDRQDIKRVDKINTDLLKNSTKGGGFGYFGKFNTEMGRMTWYGTRKDKGVLITKNDDKKIVVTPDNWEEFLHEFNN
ncbi:MAG: PH domain-containing protein [Flavisolibacter sp.]